MFQFTLTALIFLGFEIFLVLGLNLQFGMTGLLNLAFIMFYAAGAYTAGVLSGPPATPPSVVFIGGYNLPFYVGVLGGVAVAGVLSLIVGALSLGRGLRSSYFTIVTLVVGVVALQFVTQYQNLFDGSIGLLNIPLPFGGGLSSNGFTYLFLGVLASVVIVCIVLCEWLRRSPFGRLLRVIREDEVAAQVFGYNVFTTKLKVYVLGGMLSGLSGAFTIFYVGAFGPGGWSVGETLFALTCIFVGGAGSTWGVLLGAAMIELLFVQLTSLLPTIQSNPALISIGRGIAIPLLLLIVLRFRPQGLIPERVPKVAIAEQPANEVATGESLSVGVSGRSEEGGDD